MAFIGRKHTEETKKKLSEINRGEKNPMWNIHHYGEMSPMWGKHHTEETKRKIGNAQKGKVIPEEVIKKRIETWKKKVSEGWKSPLLGSLRDEEK